MENKTLSDKGKKLMVVSDVVETTSVGGGKGRRTIVEGSKGIMSTPISNKPYARSLGIKCHRHREVGRLATVTMNVSNGRQ